MKIDDVEELCNAGPLQLEPVPAEKIVLYGAGNKAREILGILRKNGCSVDACIDKKPLQVFEGLPVYQPTDPLLRQFARDGYTAIIGVFNFSVDPLEIHTLLDEIGFRRIISPAELRQTFALGETYWLAESSQMTPTSSVAGWLWGRLSDTESRQTLAEAIALRRRLDPRFLRHLSAFDQYAPATVPTPRKSLRFVDGGAYDGDTLAGLRTANREFAAVLAFEPDAGNFKHLTTNVRRERYASELLLLPCGLGQRTEQVRFHSQGLSSSSISPDGDSLVQVVCFDECFPTFRPSYVKLDIEGAELGALKGLASTIESARPALAICVYHRPSDLWEIPMLADKLLPDSNFYLRIHAWNAFEMVFYAVPREMKL